MKPITCTARFALFTSAAALLSISSGFGQAFTFTGDNLLYVESFDAMGQGTEFIPGWTSTDSTMLVGAGGSTTGSIYNVGATGASDRAFGSLASGSIAPVFGASFLNNTGSSIGSLIFAGVMEQWRSGNNAVVEVLPFEYSLDATGLASGLWTPLPSFDLVEKLTAATTSAAVDGNAPENRTEISGVTSIDWAPGQTLWIRWIDLDSAGNDGLYAIDDFSLEVVIVPPPLFWDANGATAGVGGSGSWDATTANWNSNPAGTGAPQVFASDRQAVFAGVAGNVTIAAPGVAVNGGLLFETNGYVITGGALTLGGALAAVTVSNGADTATISAPISGSAGLRKSGPGVLTLNGESDYTGGTLIEGGVLSITSDAALGAAAGPITLAGGALQTRDGIASARALGGSGAVDVATGTTLDISGEIAAEALTISGEGTLALSGAAKSIGELVFAAPGSISITGSGLAVSGGISTTHFEGTAVINGPLSLPGGTFTVTVSNGSDEVDVAFTGPITLPGAGGNDRLHKLGDGTLELSGDNSALGGVRLGVAGNLPTNGGGLRVIGNTALGAGTLQFNAGTLEIAAPMVFSGMDSFGMSLSVGASEFQPAVFAGAPLEITGKTALFRPTGAFFQHQITVDNVLTLTGALDATSGSGTSTGLTIAGDGRLNLHAAANPITDEITVKGPTFNVMHAISASSVTVNAGVFELGGSISGSVVVGDEFGVEEAAFALSPGRVSTVFVENAVFAEHATLRLELNSNATTGELLADLLTISGATTLGQGVAQLQIADLGGTALPFGTELTILDGSSGLAAGDFFEGLPHLARFSVGMNEFEIRYGVGVDAQDILLRAIPEPGAGALFLAAAGVLCGLRRRRNAGSRSVQDLSGSHRTSTPYAAGFQTRCR